jgi:alkanesulfonate monooxygenase SsuD/methylene tetrahydromethanopterin reductase-like flavin-dependent oxidoreductase (luciferase family)
MQIGVDSFVAATVDAAGRAVDPAKHLNELLEAITLADQVGLDVFGIGEHHRREFLDSAPTVILAAAAARTRRIRLTSAVTVLSAADPVRVFEEFATLDHFRTEGRRSSPAAARSSKHFRSSGWSSRITIRSLPRSLICF